MTGSSNGSGPEGAAPPRGEPFLNRPDRSAPIDDHSRPVDAPTRDAAEKDMAGDDEETVVWGTTPTFTESAEEERSGRAPPAEGDIVADRFELLSLAGVGGMAVVFRARDRETGRDVAVKILKDAFLDSPTAIDAFERETRRVASIDGPGIVPVLASGTDRGRPYSVMEFLDGTPLSRTLRAREGRPISWARTRDFVTAVGQTLAAAHARGIVHCDLKPGNLFQMADGSWRVLDFGVARELRAGKPEPATHHRRLPPEPALEALTPAYASPEQLRHMAPDVRDDIFSLAVLTYEMLTGLHPFGRLPAHEASERKLSPPRPGGMPGPAWKTLQRGLAFERKRRPKSMKAFLKGLRKRRPVWPIVLLLIAIALGGAAALRPDIAAETIRDLALVGRAGMAYVESDERAVEALLDLKAAGGPLGGPAVTLSRPLMEDRLRRLALVGPDASTDRLRSAIRAAAAGRTLYPEDAAILQLGERPFHLLLLDLADRLGRDEPMPHAVLVEDVTLLRAGNPPAYAGVEDVIVDLIRDRLLKLEDPDAVRALSGAARDLFPDEDWPEPPSGVDVPDAAPVQDLRSQPLAPPPQ